MITKGSGTAASRTVTFDVSTDRVFSEPVLQEYGRRSGVKVSPVYDTEQTKQNPRNAPECGIRRAHR